MFQFLLTLLIGEMSLLYNLTFICDWAINGRLKLMMNKVKTLRRPASVILILVCLRSIIIITLLSMDIPIHISQTYVKSENNIMSQLLN